MNIFTNGLSFKYFTYSYKHQKLLFNYVKNLKTNVIERKYGYFDNYSTVKCSPDVKSITMSIWLPREYYK